MRRLFDVSAPSHNARATSVRPRKIQVRDANWPPYMRGGHYRLDQYTSYYISTQHVVHLPAETQMQCAGATLRVLRPLLYPPSEPCLVCALLTAGCCTYVRTHLIKAASQTETYLACVCRGTYKHTKLGSLILENKQASHLCTMAAPAVAAASETPVAPDANRVSSESSGPSVPNRSTVPASRDTKSETRHNNDGNGQRNGSNKFRCRVAMACVHCRHRKIRCDGAQPSCYTCTRLQRKCEYERVSEHDNLLSRERKRLSRERKAARLAANAAQSQNGTTEDKSNGVSLKTQPMQLSKAESPTFGMPISALGMGATVAPPTDITPAMIQGDATIAPPWTTQTGTLAAVNGKDPIPWVMPPATISAPEKTLSEPLSQLGETLVSLRSTADPSLLDLSSSAPATGAPASMPLTSTLSEPSVSPAPTWSDTIASSMSPPDEGELGDTTLLPLSTMPGGSLSSEATLVDPLDVNTSIDTPLKLFSDQSNGHASSSTPSSIDTQNFSDGGSSGPGAGASMSMSPLSPQLAPPSFDAFEPALDRCALGSLDDDGFTGMDQYSSSLPASQGVSLGADLEPSSLPILSSWTRASNA